MAELPTGYQLRAPARKDAPAIADLVTAHDVADFGEPDFSEQDLLDDWGRPRFTMAHDAWVLLGPTRRIVGYAYVWESQPGVEIEADAFVLPEYAGRGLGGRLLDLVEERAVGIAAGRPMDLGMFVSSANAEKRNLLERRGFRFTRSVIRMKIDLSRQRDDLADPPPGVEIGPLDDGELDRMRDLWRAAFAAHGRFSDRRMQEWLDARFAHPAFDPSLCRVAREGDRFAGAVIVLDVGPTGYTSSVVIRPDFRGRGIGPALLQAAFVALRDRGQMRALVSVDADGGTALQALYEAAGMRVHERHDWYVKRLA